MKDRVLLGMSGGVDSSVAAMKLQKNGYDVVGISFLFSDIQKNNDSIINEAKNLAEKLNIEHHVADLRTQFRETIISYFLKEYVEGNTPFPCAKCNPDVKFKKLLEYSVIYNCSFISTGHYANLEVYNQQKYFYKGSDTDKDQSFFLWGLSKKIRDKLILPLGKMTKEEVRNYASNLNFKSLAKKKDSLGICFMEGNNYRDFLSSEGIVTKPGNFINEQNEIFGTHRGITNYTIGQRRGLGIQLNEPVFVSEIRALTNEIVLSEYKSLYKNKIIINNVYFVDIHEVMPEKVWITKIRYRLQDTPCKIKILNKKQAEIEFLEPLAMISKGQTAVFYDNDRLIGGGFIASSE